MMNKGEYEHRTCGMVASLAISVREAHKLQKVDQFLHIVSSFQQLLVPFKGIIQEKNKKEEKLK